ncbi:DUF6264 family protein [Microbacterium invictum]|uniref:Uncharacterized protein n=1 Tax=Microbacterium invictum TaxID=515415 RepID=A0AA40SM24_9MICO|nr:DUF6264 family protein [Microbacterium invictum]MBB4138713.1 hypothetical protein [Microbacterium invictum]
MSTPDEPRPAPQYGEYATPEEQRARIQQPDPALTSSPAAAPVEPPYAPHPPHARPTTDAAQPSRAADRIITFALLAYGLVTVITAVPQMLDFTGFAQTWMEVAGVDAEFTNHEAGILWGRIGALIFAGGWLATALLSWRSVRRRRLSWWIPLVGAIVTFIAASFCLVVPLLGDPGIAQHFSTLG